MVNIEPGTVVFLKSGGPRMTVKRLLGPDNKLSGIDAPSAVCQWFVEGDVKQDIFPVVSLTGINTSHLLLHPQ